MLANQDRGRFELISNSFCSKILLKFSDIHCWVVEAKHPFPYLSINIPSLCLLYVNISYVLVLCVSTGLSKVNDLNFDARCHVQYHVWSHVPCQVRCHVWCQDHMYIGILHWGHSLVLTLPGMVFIFLFSGDARLPIYKWCSLMTKTKFYCQQNWKEN